MNPTEEQRAICDAVADGSKSLMVSAYAGTAKTTTLEMAAPAVKLSSLALAFNKKIAVELQGRLPPNFKVQTLNSLGFGAWLKSLQKPFTVKVDDRKLGTLVTAVAKDRRINLTQWQWDAVRSAVTSAMQAGLSPKNIGNPLVLDTDEIWSDLIDVPEYEDEGFIMGLAREVLSLSINLARQGHVSYDDQIYCPTILGGHWLRYARVFVDEAQDLSPLNHRMLDFVAGGPIVAVGDPKQAIYQFRGADANSMTTMRSLREDDWEDLRLTMTFRCPKTIVERQQEHAPGYRAHENNPEGSFVPMLSSWSWASIKELLNDVPSVSGPSCAILCRNNAPLLSLAFKLIRSGVGCQMLGRDIGKGLITLSKKLSPADETKIIKFSILLNEWEERQTALARANNKPARVEKINDQAECMRATILGTEPSTVGDLRLILERLFSRENSQVLLSSCHRAKGLEWPLVIHLDPWRIPSKQAQQAALFGNPLALEQEHNLHYVCETRTKHTLVNANMENFQ